MTQARKYQNMSMIVVIALLAALAGAVLHQRDTIRGWWWGRQIETAHSLEESVYAVSRLVATGEKGVPAACRLLRSDNPSVRLTAVWTLGQIGGIRAAEALMDAMKDPSLEVRLAAAANLGMYYEDVAREDLVRVLQTGSRDEAMAAAVALERMRSAIIPRILGEAALRLEADVAVRAQAIECLGRRGDAAHAEGLLELLEDRSMIPVPLMGRLRDEIMTQRIADQHALRLDSETTNQHLPLSLADVAAEALRRITGLECGYQSYLEPAELEAVARCWAGALHQTDTHTERGDPDNVSATSSDRTFID
jgi:hypothetical protein